MVRTNNEILAEKNDEDTVLTDTLTILSNNCIIVGNGTKKITKLTDSQYGSIVYLSNGEIQQLAIQPNKLLGIDANGNLAWL